MLPRNFCHPVVNECKRLYNFTPLLMTTWYSVKLDKISKPCHAVRVMGFHKLDRTLETRGNKILHITSYLSHHTCDCESR